MAIRGRGADFPARWRVDGTRLSCHCQTSVLRSPLKEDVHANPGARTEKIDLRVTPVAKRTLQTAAAVARRSVSDFVLESALTRAEETLADRQRFGLDEAQWAAFQEALDAPAKALPRIRRLLEEPSVFEGGGHE